MIGLWFDELEVGRMVELGTYQFTADNIRRFSTTFVPVGFHMDAAQAAEGLFGATAAAGLHTCCGWMTCFIATNTRERERLAGEGKVLPEIGPSPGLQNIRWPNPVFPGDLVAYRFTITDKRELASKPAWGLVSLLCEGHKIDGGPAVSFASKVLVARRSGQTG